MQSRIGLVGEVHRPVEWPNNDKDQCGSGCADHNRCIQEGMGAVWQDQTTQGVWSEEEQVQHINVLELKSAFYALKAFAKQMTDVHMHLRVDNMSTMAQINKMRGTQVKSVTGCNSAVVGLLSVEEDHAYSRTLARAFESGGRHAVSNIRGLQQLAADARSVQAARQALGSYPGRLVCRSVKCTGQEVCELEADPEAWQVDAFTVLWIKELGYAFPPFCLIGRCLASVDRESRDGVSHPGMADTAMVLKSVGMLTDFPVLLPQVSNLLMGPTGKSHPLMQSQ